jgi:dephospho-CoA kinase
MDTDKSIMLRLNSIAGKDLYTTGSLDRIDLAKLIFSNTSLLARVNSLVHPAVYDQFKRWAVVQTTPYVILEAAILFESGGANHLDRILSVVAPIEDRISRVIKRNSLSEEQVLDRVRNQMDDEARIKLSDYVIYNAENEMIIPSILKLHTEIVTLINTGI